MRESPPRFQVSVDISQAWVTPATNIASAPAGLTSALMPKPRAKTPESLASVLRCGESEMGMIASRR
jgi:hypothetical protein